MSSSLVKQKIKAKWLKCKVLVKQTVSISVVLSAACRATKQSQDIVHLFDRQRASEVQNDMPGAGT